MTNRHELKCRECGKLWGNQPKSICEACFSPLELTYDLRAIGEAVTRDDVARRSPVLWRYSELLPLPAGFEPPVPTGFTPLVEAPRLAKEFGATRLYLKNDGVSFPTLSFKDRVVALALAQARRFNFDAVACSSTGNLANAVAAQARRLGLDAWVFIPADLEPAKVINSQVYGAHVVRIAGNYDQVNRLCVQVADELNWGFVNGNLRPYYSEGSKTFGYEIAEQLGWRLPDNVVIPMAGASLITKVYKAFQELIALGWVEPKPVKIFGAQATGCSPVTTAVKAGQPDFEPQKPSTLARSLAIGNPSDGHYAIKVITQSGGWGEDVSDPEIIRGIQLVAETEGIFTETAGGVTAGVTQKLYAQGRIQRDELTVVALTGNGLKTTDALHGQYTLEEAIPPRPAAFQELLQHAQPQAAVAVAG